MSVQTLGLFIGILGGQVAKFEMLTQKKLGYAYV